MLPPFPDNNANSTTTTTTTTRQPQSRASVEQLHHPRHPVEYYGSMEQDDRRGGEMSSSTSAHQYHPPCSPPEPLHHNTGVMSIDSDGDSNNSSNSGLGDESNGINSHHDCHDRMEQRRKQPQQQQDLGLAKFTQRNFLWMSIIFSVNPSAAIACMALAVAKLGSTVGAWSSGCLFASYTISAICGIAALTAKRMGARNTMIVGMFLFCIYVGCFLVAIMTTTTTTTAGATGEVHAAFNSTSTTIPNSIMTTMRTTETQETQAALICVVVGSILGGTGASLAWTAQGSYLAQASETYSLATGTMEWHTATSKFASQFAFVYLLEEMAVTALSTILRSPAVFGMNVPWSHIFFVYALLALISTLAMLFVVHDYGRGTSPSAAAITKTTVGNGATSFHHHDNDDDNDDDKWYKQVTALFQLYRDDVKLKWLSFWPALFGITSSFLNAFVSGQALGLSHLKDADSSHVGLLTAWSALVAALCSLLYERMILVMGTTTFSLSTTDECSASYWCCWKQLKFNYEKSDPSNAHTTSSSSCPRTDSTPSSTSSSSWPTTLVMMLGALSFMAVPLGFVLQPQLDTWTLWQLSLVYAAQGSGRAVFESTLKSVMADYYPYEKEGAFASIVWNMGWSSSLGYFAIAPHTSSTSCSLLLNDDSSWISPYCLTYKDGSQHNILWFEGTVLVIGLLAIIGYLRANQLLRQEALEEEQQQQEQEGDVWEKEVCGDEDEEGGGEQYEPKPGNRRRRRSTSSLRSSSMSSYSRASAYRSSSIAQYTLLSSMEDQQELEDLYNLNDNDNDEGLHGTITDRHINIGPSSSSATMTTTESFEDEIITSKMDIHDDDDNNDKRIRTSRNMVITAHGLHHDLV